MADVKVRGMSTTYRLASKLYRIISAAMPEILQMLTPAEKVVVLELLNAVRVFLESAPYPGTDNDPGTQA